MVSPDNLEVIAVYCHSSGWRKNTAIIMVRDIREIAREGIIVDSLEDIEEVGEVVRLKELVERKFQLAGTLVETESGQELGKVEDYTVSDHNYLIQKLYLKQSLLKNLLLNNLIIDRTQVVSVTDKKIIVRDATVPKPKLGTQPVPKPRIS